MQLEETIQWDGSRLNSWVLFFTFLLVWLLFHSHSHDYLSTLSLFSEQRLGFSILPLRVGLWLWCIQRLTTIKVQISVGLGLVDLGEFGWGFSQGGGSGSSAGLEDWVMLVLSRWRSKILKWLHWKASWVISFSAVLRLFSLHRCWLGCWYPLNSKRHSTSA